MATLNAGRNLLLYTLTVILATLVSCRAMLSPATPASRPLDPTVTPRSTETVASPSPTPGPETVFALEVMLVQAEESDEMERQAIVNRHMAQITATPLTSGTRAAFLWRGGGQQVRLVGDMNNWDIDNAPALTQLSGTDLWYLMTEYEPDARLDYKFAVDDEPWQLDPLNPRTVMSSFGPNSELRMPQYETPPELIPPDWEIPSGELISHTLESKHLNQTRTFFVYTPPGELVGQQPPSVYIHDGSDYLNLINAPTILDRLIADRQIPPLMVVFIPPINRDMEYSLNSDYVRFLADELVPFVQKTYGTDPDPARTAILGSSMGGLAAVHAAFSRPNVFGLVASQSGTFSLNNDAIIRRIDRSQTETTEPLLARLYLVVGTYETAVGRDSEGGNYLAANRTLASLLEWLGYTYEYEERPEGHSWGMWQATLGRALSSLFSR